MASLIGVGDNTVDTYIHQGLRYPGGNAVNVAVLAHRYDHPSAYLGWFGNDRNGQLLLTSLQQEGLDISHCKVVEGPNGFSEVNLVDGERVFGAGTHGASAKITLEADDYAYIRQFDIVHTSTYSHLENCLADLKKAAHCLSFDFSDRQDPRYIQPILPSLDVALLSRPVFPEMEQWMHEIFAQGPRLVLVTCGAQGAWLYDGHTLFHQEVIPVKVVDTLGAGDAFAARFLVEALSGTPPQRSMELAAHSAAENCLHFGAFGHAEKI
jgi:fructoselysine 6-kinase